jgi:drug/metabolite transporter (DMT)-like permease
VKLYPFKPCRWKEIGLMGVGVVCAGVFTMARILGAHSSGEENSGSKTLLGVFMCICSLLCGSLNLALAGVLGETKLNVYDTVAYMAIPATLFLLPIAYFYQKQVPGQWGELFGEDTMSDWQILRHVWSLNKTTMAWLILSGVFSFIYNIIQFSIVHTLSPSATAFGGNFNKAALIFLTLLLPFLRVHELPGPPYIQVIWGAVIVNIAAFSYYSYLQIQAKQEAFAKAPQILAEDDNEDSYDSDDDDTTEASDQFC